MAKSYLSEGQLHMILSGTPRCDFMVFKWYSKMWFYGVKWYSKMWFYGV